MQTAAEIAGQIKRFAARNRNGFVCKKHARADLGIRFQTVSSQKDKAKIDGLNAETESIFAFCRRDVRRGGRRNISRIRNFIFCKNGERRGSEKILITDIYFRADDAPDAKIRHIKMTTVDIEFFRTGEIARVKRRSTELKLQFLVAAQQLVGISRFRISWLANVCTTVDSFETDALSLIIFCARFGVVKVKKTANR